MPTQRQSRVQLQLRVAALERELRKKDAQLANRDAIQKVLVEGIKSKREQITDLEDKVEELEEREAARAAVGCTGCVVQDIVAYGHTTRNIWHVHGPNVGGGLAPPPKSIVVVNNYSPINRPPVYGAPMPFLLSLDL